MKFLTLAIESTKGYITEDIWRVANVQGRNPLEEQAKSAVVVCSIFEFQPPSRDSASVQRLFFCNKRQQAGAGCDRVK